MKTPTAQKFLVLLPLIKCLEAQFVPESEARLQAWRAYGSFVSQSLTAGVPLTPGQDFIYITPPNTAAVRGGTPCPDSVTNFDLFNLVNGLQNISEPLMDINGASYIDNLYTYLQSVDLKTATPTDAQLAQIQTLTNNLSAVQSKFKTESKNAYTNYLADVRAQAAGQAFGSWVTKNDPVYSALQRQVQTANTALQNYEVSVYGPQYQTLSTQRDRITNQAGDELFTEPGYNMPVYGNAGSYNVQINPFAQHQLTNGIIYKPLYSLQGGFQETCDSWINYTGPVNTVYNWSMQNVNGKDWSSLGHSSSVTSIGGSLWGLISANHGDSTDTTVFDSWTDNYSTAVTLSLTMKGLAVFSIGAGFWDIGGVRSTYPNILPAPYGQDTLKNRVRLQRLLIGSEVGLTITVKDTGLWNSMSQFIQDTKTSTGGGLSIFGFQFGGGSSSATHRNITDLQMASNAEGGVMTIAPTPKGITVMLGALGKAL